ncbi:glucose-6-phosphate isomerase [bacterium]|nr:glucose-6-phosphate isomerase [bacterium]
MKEITLNYKNVNGFISDKEFLRIQNIIDKKHDLLINKKCPGNDWLGWMDFPDRISRPEVDDLMETGEWIRENSDVFVSIGIGGSYLGARAAIHALTHSFHNEISSISPRIYYAGNSIYPDYLADLLDVIRDKRITLNVISKSGSTLETSLVFRVLKNYMLKEYGEKGTYQRIFATTNAHSGALRKLSEETGIKAFVIPDDIGGRFSVLTPVGLLPMAVVGIGIDEMLQGARRMAQMTQSPDIFRNISYIYAAIRNILYEQGKVIEILANFTHSMCDIARWWLQLFGESEGKDGKGIYPAIANYTTDLHSMGQLVQQGMRNVFETFLIVEEPGIDVRIPEDARNLDGLNNLAGHTFGYVNKKAKEATEDAHYSGGVPNLTINIPKLNAYYVGQLFYFFEKAVAMSGLLLGVNPFNQPGVEAYKMNLKELLKMK